MNSRVENRPCQEIFLEYVIVDKEPNGRELRTLAFDKQYQQETTILNLTNDSDYDSDYLSPTSPSVRRSFSTPLLPGSAFKIGASFEINFELLKNMKKIGFGSQSDVYRGLFTLFYLCLFTFF